MKLRKSFFAVLMVAVLCCAIFTLCACGDKAPEGKDGGDNQSTVKKWKVTFDNNYEGGGSKVVEVEDGARIDKPADPTRLGYTFKGWFVDSQCLVEQVFRGTKNPVSYSPIDKVTSDVTFYAGWTAEGETPDTPTPDEPETPDTPEVPDTPKPENQVKTFYFSNDKNQNPIYSYIWKNGGKEKKPWPGELMTYLETNEYGQKTYKVEVDLSLYDRIIFTDNKDLQTKDLVLSSASSAFYFGNDKAGCYTFGATDYGKVQTITLTDTKNLSERGGSKKVHVYLPAGYQTSGEDYGVLYMFDGQNLFESQSGYTCSASQSWLVDNAITAFMQNGGKGVIIVGIDNGDMHRDSELTQSLEFGKLTPLGAPDYGNFTKGRLDKIGNFMQESLIPYINKNYRTKTDRENTGIAGSSSGGLASFYLGLRDNETYGYVGTFSPATSLFYKDSWDKFLSQKDLSLPQKMYIYCGRESDSLENMLYSSTDTTIATTVTLKDLLLKHGYTGEIFESYTSKANHNETFWRIAFAEFLPFALKED